MASTFGKEIIQALTELKNDLEAGVDIEKKYVVHRYELGGKNGFGAKAVKKTRMALGIGLTGFAEFLGVSRQTVLAWEAGRRTPTRLARRFMEEIQRQPELFRSRLQHPNQGNEPNSRQNRGTLSEPPLSVSASALKEDIHAQHPRKQAP